VFPGHASACANAEVVELFGNGLKAVILLPAQNDGTDFLNFCGVHDEAAAQPREAVRRDTFE